MIDFKDEWKNPLENLGKYKIKMLIKTKNRFDLFCF